MFEYKTTKRFDKKFKRFRKYDKETTAKIKILMADTLEHPTYELGHPEQLRHLGANVWSRHIDKKNRVRYSIEGGIVYVERCCGHYNDH
jgi:Txe/YoeB family toxin of Txe-Axe toxin-antitoxin module